jgi:hypothetical protein
VKGYRLAAKWIALAAVLAAIALASCAPAATPAPAVTQPSLPAVATQAAPPASPTQALPTPTAQATRPALTPTPGVEGRLVEMEWPGRLRLGDSDVVRLALVPGQNGYDVQAEFPDHSLATQTVPVERPNGYQLYAAGILDGVAFDISPAGEQEHLLPLGQTVTWRWTVRAHSPGEQGLSVALWLRWRPDPGIEAQPREALAFSRAMRVQVSSVLGLTRTQASTTGAFSLLLGGSLGVFVLVTRPRSRRARLERRSPNPTLKIEPPPGITLGDEEGRLLQALFNRYGRLVLLNEFLSGYSGARTFLALPLHPDGRADAHTIVKVGPAGSIRREFENYESYVKDSLPPITARIQHVPVLDRRTHVRHGQKAALQYTFIGEPGRQPVSLRQALLQEPDPGLLFKLFETFGPNWWMQRQPYVFRAAQEYDRLLPPHYELEPLPCRAAPTQVIDERCSPGRLVLHPDQVVLVRSFALGELRSDGRSLTLRGVPAASEPALRLRWLSEQPPVNTPARVTADRAALLARLVDGFELFGLPDPLARLPDLLGQTVMGTRSIIHGDLNLENVLVGPGNFIWLIDFAQTRPGHPLYDFARLKAELIAQVLARRVASPAEFLDLLRTGDPLLSAIDEIAAHCLFNPNQPGEATQANILACLGALKFSNLDEKARRCLYVAAAYYCL